MKRVKVFSTATGITDVNTSARTWGSLRDELRTKGLITDDMKVIVKELQVSFEGDEAELPTGLGKNDDGIVTHDFTLFTSPTKTKSGYGK